MRAPLTPLLLAIAIALPARAQAPSYRVLVGAESDDQVALIEFVPCPAGGAPAGAAPAAPCGARVVRTYPVGFYPADVESPHGVVASPDGKHFFVTLAHGKPHGLLARYDLETGRADAVTELGMFPATVDVSPDGQLVYAINFNFEDPEMRPSSLSIVDAVTMSEIARPVTCRMPHGSQLGPRGERHYSACMMDDLLVEVDAHAFTPARFFRVARGREGPAEPPAADVHAGHHGGAHPAAADCSPTWAEPSAGGGSVFVACTRSGEIVEVDVAGWTLRRRWTTPAAPYNLAATPDGRLLVATQKGPGTTTIWRLADAALLAEIPGTRRVASGVVVSADSRYAFVTLEGVGGEPGTVDVIDLRALRRVASVDTGKQAGGIALLP